MIFSSRLAGAVLAGTKTVTRRPVKPDQDRTSYRVGRSYPVQPGRGRKAVGRIIVTDVGREELGRLTAAEAIAEGFGRHAPVVAFARYWLQLYDGPFRPALDHASDEEVLERWRDRYGLAEVWVIRFELDPSAPARLLHRQSERGYTSVIHNAVPEEPEAVDLWSQTLITRHANRRDEEVRRMRQDEARKRLKGDLRDLTIRMAWARSRAHAAGLDPKDEMRRVMLDIRRLERGVDTGEGEESAPPGVQASEG